MLQRKAKLFTAGLILLIMSVLLAACNSAVPTSQPGASTATAGATTTPSVTTTPGTKPNPANPTATSKPGYNPAIRFSADTVTIGNSLSISGSGYPGKTALKVWLSYPNTPQFSPFSEFRSEPDGNFSTKVVLDRYDHAKSLDPGKLIIMVATSDGSVAASAPVTLVAAATPTPTKKPTQPTATATVTIPSQPIKPVLSTNTTVNLGSPVELTGSGFPVNTDLNVLGGVQNPGTKFGSVKTSAKGAFQFTADFSKIQNPFPGPYTFVALTADNKHSASITVTFVSTDPKYSLTVAKEFFDFIRQGNYDAATFYLGIGLRTRMTNEKLTLAQLLGLPATPSKVEVTLSNEAKGYNVKAVLNLPDGTKTMFVFVTPDKDGSVKVIDFTKPV